jgi:alkylation response protein AidB-like acyl-CoA dehydrogenase
MVATSDWVGVARSFRSQIEAGADEAERNRQLSADLIEAWRDAGLFNLWVPREYGGEELDFTTFLAVIEEIAAADGSAGWTLMIGSSGSAFAAYLGPEEAKGMFASGRAILAGSVTPRDAAEAVEGGYRVTGRWPFASGCPNADWIVAFSFLPEDESLSTGASPLPGPPELLALVMPASECRIIDTWTSMGMRATASHDFEVKDVFVPKGRSFRGGPGFLATARVAGAMYKAGEPNLLQLALIGVHLGIARGAIESVIRLANEKTPTMRPSKLRESQVAQGQIGRAESLRLAARALALETARELQQALGVEGKLSPRHRAVRQMMVAQVATLCAQAVDIAYEVGGTTGVYAGNKLERCFRDIHVATQHMGVSPNQLTMAGLTLLNEAQAAASPP